MMAKAALLYWVPVFAIAFCFGVVRVLWVEPAFGHIAATVLEVPVILLVSWVIARRVMRRFAVVVAGQALALGALAFVLLMASEVLLALVLGNGAARDWVARMQTVAGAIGLVGQSGFALMPWFILRSAGRGADQRRR